MSEGASQLDLQVLSNQPDLNTLVPNKKKTPMYKRSGSQIFLIFLILGLLATLIRWLQQDFHPTYPPILMLIIIIMVVQRENVKDIFILKEDGLLIPYMWFYRRKVPFTDILKIVDDEIEDPATGNTYRGIRILVDSPLIKLNVTGMQTSSILLSTMIYDSLELNGFANELTRLKRDLQTTPNTLAQRLTDQVTRAWNNRWKLVLFYTMDGLTEGLIYILVIETLIWGFFGVSTFPVLGMTFIGFLTLVLLFIQLANKPQAIIGIRPHELGPLIYDEEELVTSVRFIVICLPNTVHLQDCDVNYPDGATKQVGRLSQLQPEYVEPGELTYGIAQIVGNHTKATGATISFTYKETEDNPNRVYEVPIAWG